MENERAFFSWEAHEEKHIERTNDWYWGLGLIAVFGSAGAFLTKNFLFGVFIILAAVVVFLSARKPKEKTFFQITAKGVRRSDTLYRYKTIDSFWVEVEEDDEPTLLLHTSRVMAPIISIPLSEEMDPEQIRSFLGEILEEKVLQEPKLYKMLDRIGL
jgi:hypothetical protein